MNTPVSPIIVALDFPDLDPALALVDRLDAKACRVKVGKELFTRAGPASVSALTDRGFDVFLDLKFHDIPNTVAGACRAAADLGCWMLNVHAGGGGAMMEAARKALDNNENNPLLIAVTVLTSLNDQVLHDVGVSSPAVEQVCRLARLAADAGLDGVVCSPREIAAMRDQNGAGFTLVTPGVRPAGSGADDQVRTATPAEAIAAGANYLVIGRPITQAVDPNEALLAINDACTAAHGKSIVQGA